MSTARRVTQTTRRITGEQEPFLTARSLATTYGSGYTIPEHSHGWHQLLYARTGAMTVFAGQMSWMIPPGRAVFIPAERAHSIRMWGEVAMRSLYFPAAFRAAALEIAECRAISVTPLLRELILRVVELAALDSRVEAEAHLMSVLMDELDGASTGTLALPLPADSRALAAAMRVLKNPADSMTLEALARECGVGARTLERLFHAETGMSFGLWRQKARLLESIRLLVESKSVTHAALESGYSSASAYIVAFKQTFGCTPKALSSSYF
jgi:AraC-like DNA-binding protein/quercetin dioxygenase-like cupin family protein